MGSMLDAALKYNLIEKSGSWYSYKGEKVGQGREKTIEYFEHNSELTGEIVNELRAIMFPPKEAEEAKDGKGKAEKKA